MANEIDDERLKALIDYCSFENLKKNPSFELKVPTNEPNGNRRFVEMNLFRKGEIGDWKNHLDANMSQKIDDMVAKNLKYKKHFKFEPTKMK